MATRKPATKTSVSSLVEKKLAKKPVTKAAPKATAAKKLVKKVAAVAKKPRKTT
jgi:hypothetical protein